jgi:serine/threonine protein kinase
MIAAGALLAGKYKVGRVIGTGGMGVILAATHVDLEQRVAIKLLTAAAAHDPDRVRRFSREAKAAARIKSEHVVRILDCGTDDSGAPFIVMEHLEGSDLAFVLKSRGGLPVEDALDYILQACDGVAEAHLMGIIHRDLKPANLFLTHKQDGVESVKVLDFGASKLTAECSLASRDGLNTEESSLMGSPRYMAPEQLKATTEVDHRVDVYALGATLYELLAGEPAFHAKSLTRTFTKILTEPPPSLRAVRPDVPVALEGAVFRALAKDPAERFQSVKELAEALAPFASARSMAVLAQIASVGKPRPADALQAAPKVLERVDGARVDPRVRGGVIAVGVSLGVFGAVVALLISRQRAVAAPHLSTTVRIEGTSLVAPANLPPLEAEAMPTPPAPPPAVVVARRAPVRAPEPPATATKPAAAPPRVAGDFSEFGERK